MMKGEFWFHTRLDWTGDWRGVRGLVSPPEVGIRQRFWRLAGLGLRT
jgi:hypothetical protein